MRQALPSHKPLIIDILSAAFDTNKNVNWLAGKGRQRMKNIRRLCAYSYELCSLFGEVYVSEDRKACALVLLPDQKRLTLKSIGLEPAEQGKGIGTNLLQELWQTSRPETS